MFKIYENENNQKRYVNENNIILSKSKSIRLCFQFKNNFQTRKQYNTQQKHD